MKILAISDTHNEHRKLELPAADLLIHSGDLTHDGEASVIEDFILWLSQQDSEHKVFIVGNHDSHAEHHPDAVASMASDLGVHYLHNSGVRVRGVSIWGSPYTPRFMDWSFMYEPGVEMARCWQQIPVDTDILVSHGPPFGTLDELLDPQGRVVRAGCRELAKKVRELKPRLHLFGHIHEGHGVESGADTFFVNASSMNEAYQLCHTPIMLDYTDSTIKVADFAKPTVTQHTAGHSVAETTLQEG